MTEKQFFLKLMELAGAHTKSMSPGIRDGFGTTGEVLARFEAYADAMRNAAAKTGGVREDGGA